MTCREYTTKEIYKELYMSSPPKINAVEKYRSCKNDKGHILRVKILFTKKSGRTILEGDDGKDL